jgi:hypothetical protein
VSKGEECDVMCVKGGGRVDTLRLATLATSLTKVLSRQKFTSTVLL